MSILQFRPRLTAVAVQQIAQSHYQLTATATPLPSDRDQNFLLTTESGQKFVLKIANGLEKRPMLELENAAMSHLAQHGICCPQIVPTASGTAITTISPQDQTHFVRLVTHLPGKPLAVVEHTEDLLVAIGRLLGQLSQALATFAHPAAHRDFHWDMQQAHKIIRQHLPLIPDQQRQALVRHFLTQFETEVLPVLPQFRASILYNDANGYNLLANNGRLAVLDFGDMVYSRTLFDLAIGIAYTLLNNYPPPATERGADSLESDDRGESKNTLLAMAVTLFRAYHQVSPVTAVEMAHLYTLIAIRWCTSVTIAAHQIAQEPDNDYLAISQAGAWAALEHWHTVDPQRAHQAFQMASK